MITASLLLPCSYASSTYVCRPKFNAKVCGVVAASVHASLYVLFVTTGTTQPKQYYEINRIRDKSYISNLTINIFRQKVDRVAAMWAEHFKVCEVGLRRFHLRDLESAHSRVHTDHTFVEHG